METNEQKTAAAVAGERYAFGERLRLLRDGSDGVAVWYCGISPNGDGLRVRFVDGTVHLVGPMEVTR